MELTHSTFGKNALGFAAAVDYIDWAVEMLELGYDSRSLGMLASFERSTSSISDVEQYFYRAINELNFVKPSQTVAVRNYACNVAQQIINGQIEPKAAVEELYKICVATRYGDDFVIWFELEEALGLLLISEQPWSYEGITLKNFDEIVKLEAKNFIDKLKLS